MLGHKTIAFGVCSFIGCSIEIQLITVVVYADCRRIHGYGQW